MDKEDYEAKAFRLEMENARLKRWLEHIAEMKNSASIDLREAAHYALAGDLI